MLKGFSSFWCFFLLLLFCSFSLFVDIVSMHGGKLSVFSEGEGKGCTFTIELPLRVAAQTAPPPVFNIRACEPALVSEAVPPTMRLSTHDQHSHMDPQRPTVISSRASGDLVKKGLRLNYVADAGESIDEKSNEDSLPAFGGAGQGSPVNGTPTRIFSPVSSVSGKRPEEFQSQSEGGNLRTGMKPLVAGWSRAFGFLVVDDSLINRKTLSRALISQGHSVRMAADGVEAIDVIFPRVPDASERETAPIDVILMDNLMPRMSGPEATQGLRELGYRGFIIALTGNIFEDDIQVFKEAGADFVLSKPLDMASLQKILSSNSKPLLPLVNIPEDFILSERETLEQAPCSHAIDVQPEPSGGDMSSNEATGNYHPRGSIRRSYCADRTMDAARVEEGDLNTFTNHSQYATKIKHYFSPLYVYIYFDCFQY